MLCFKVNNLKLKNVNNLVKNPFFLQSITQSQSKGSLHYQRSLHFHVFRSEVEYNIFPSKINNIYNILSKASL